jgi:hypothetical protein
MMNYGNRNRNRNQATGYLGRQAYLLEIILRFLHPGTNTGCVILIDVMKSCNEEK